MKSAVIMIVCMLALVFLAVPIHRVYAATTLVTDPTGITKAPADVGTTFAWSVNVVDVADLYGFDINVTWDNALITFRTVSYTTELNSIWGAGNWLKVFNETGVGYYHLLVSGKPPAVEYTNSGSTPLFTITFNVLGVSSNHDRLTTLHFAKSDLSDIDSNAIANTQTDGTYTMTGTKPTVSMSGSNVLAWALGNETTISLGMSDAYDVNGFGFEVHFNTTLLDYVTGSDTWGASGTGTITVDEVGGKVTGSVVLSPSISGSYIAVSFKLKASYRHVWKNPSITPWQNILTASIFYQKANLDYSGDPTLNYDRSGTFEINVGADVTYTWSPIKGDTTCDGIVDIYDLTDVAQYYLTTPTSPSGLWPTAEPNCELAKVGGVQIIDLYDLIVVASNYGAKGAP